MVTRDPGPVSEWGGWLILAAIAGTAGVGGLVWLAGEASFWLGDRPAPGGFVSYLTGLLQGGTVGPSAGGWLMVGVPAAALIAAATTGVVVIVQHRAGRHQVDRAARRMSTAKDRRRLSEATRRQQSKRLVPGAPDWTGGPLGTSIPGGVALRTGPEDMAVHIWGPRRGKSTSIAIPSIIEAPGPVIATSNRRDLSDTTQGLRSQAGRTWLFDPQALGSDGEPTFFFNPLRLVRGTTDARKLAAIFDASTRDANAKMDAHWDTAGKELLAWLMLAAACDNRALAAVWEWVNDENDITPVRLLEYGGHHGPARAVEGVLGQPDKMRGSVFGTAQRMASPLVNPHLMAWVTPRDDLPEFDCAAFVSSRDTLYALSREGEGSGSAFTAALTAHICESAERIAARNASGRLNIPLRGILDETANCVRWPELPQLFSHYGGRGILLDTYFQTWDQGVAVFGQEGMATLWSAATIRVYGGGVAEAGSDFLSKISLGLIGEHDEWIRQSYSYGPGSRQTTRGQRKERTLPAADLASLPFGRAIVFASGSRPIAFKTIPWMDRPYAAQLRAAQQKARHDAGLTGSETGAGGVDSPDWTGWPAARGGPGIGGRWPGMGPRDTGPRPVIPADSHSRGSTSGGTSGYGPNTYTGTPADGYANTNATDGGYAGRRGGAWPGGGGP